MAADDHPDDRISVEEAAGILGVGQEQVETMIHDGLLTPTDGSGTRTLLRAEVMAVGELGG